MRLPWADIFCHPASMGSKQIVLKEGVQMKLREDALEILKEISRTF